jgi:hypothetical protein
VDALRGFTMFWIVARDAIFRANWILLFMFSIVVCHIAGAQTTNYVSTEGNEITIKRNTYETTVIDSTGYDMGAYEHTRWVRGKRDCTC